MNIHNHNPPFRNSNLNDFFDFECENRYKAIFLQNWIGDNFPDLTCQLMYMVPMYKLDKSRVFYLNYYKTDGGLDLEICFSKGAIMDDNLNIFSTKNTTFKSIAIISIEEEFMGKVAFYITQAINLC